MTHPNFGYFGFFYYLVIEDDLNPRPHPFSFLKENKLEFPTPKDYFYQL
jgi:hypothetical protein